MDEINFQSFGINFSVTFVHGESKLSKGLARRVMSTFTCYFYNSDFLVFRTFLDSQNVLFKIVFFRIFKP